MLATTAIGGLLLCAYAIVALGQDESAFGFEPVFVLLTGLAFLGAFLAGVRDTRQPKLNRWTEERLPPGPWWVATAIVAALLAVAAAFGLAGAIAG